jgi:hypothetical protein
MRKLRGRDLYKVFNTQTKRVFAKGATRDKAQHQLRLLRAIENSPEFAQRLRRTARKPRRARANDLDTGHVQT